MEGSVWGRVWGRRYGKSTTGRELRVQSRSQKARATGRTQVRKRDGLVLNSREALYSVWNGANLGRASGIQ